MNDELEAILEEAVDHLFIEDLLRFIGDSAIKYELDFEYLEDVVRDCLSNKEGSENT